MEASARRIKREGGAKEKGSKKRLVQEEGRGGEGEGGDRSNL